jgi:Spy/CpxP family protein refolding chaperone
MKLRFLLPIAFAGALAAQTPAPQAAGGLKAYLGLSDQQVTELRQLRKSEFQAVRPMFQDMRTKAMALRNLLKTSNPDPAAVGQATLALKTEREQIAAATANYRNQAVQKLTPDQQAKLQALAQARKLAPDFRQASALGLLPGGRGAGFGFMRGHMMMGHGAGAAR